jgi:hypothetical protein
MAHEKVFVIGFHKTGTSSLGLALKALGYRVCFNLQWNNPQVIRDMTRICRDLTARYDAFEDNPWPLLYRELHEWHPTGRFILTIRETDAWYRSAANWFGSKDTLMRRFIYGDDAGSPIGNEAIYRARYDRHNQDVRRYFEAMPDQLLTVDVTRGEGWPALCRFLDKPVPTRPFPHAKPGTSATAAQKSGADRPSPTTHDSTETE